MADLMESLWIFLPLLGLFAAHAPVLRFDLLPQLRRPIDAGLTFRRRRIFGENKTWRGAFAMSGGVVAATIVLSFVPLWWNHLPAEVRASGPLVLGILLGLGSALAELPNSFLKRQLDIAPGARRLSPLGMLLIVFDQGDFVLGVSIALLPLWTIPVAHAAAAFAAVVAAHLLLNVVGYGLGVRKTAL
ncbi:MAG: CDP-archaeol synthase [Candidatus Binatia bacterium]